MTSYDKAQNLVPLALSHGLRFGGSLVVSVLLMRWLSLAEFGVVGTVTSLAALAVCTASLGLPRLLVPEIVRAPGQTRSLVAAGLRGVLVGSGLSIAGFGVGAWALDGRPVVVWATVLATGAVGVRALHDVVQTAFHGHRRMGLQLAGHTWGRAAFVGLTALLIWAGAGVVGVFAAHLLAAALTLRLFFRAWPREWGAPPSLGLADWSQTRRLARRSAPFGLNMAAAALYLGVDVLMLSWFAGDEAVGLYRSAAVLIVALPALAQILNSGLYPRMARHLGNPEAAGRELAFAHRMLLLLSMPVALGGLCLAEPLLVLMGGSAYAPAAPALMLMLPLLPLRFVGNGLGMAASALERQGWKTRAATAAAVFNIVANLWAIPRWGAAGAAATTTLTELVFTAVLALGLRGRVAPHGLGGALARTTGPALVMAACVFATDGLPVMVRVAVGVVVYLPLAAWGGAWRAGDWGRLRGI